MHRSRWIGALAGALTFLAPAAAEPLFKPNQVLNVREDGKPPRKCKAIKCWTEKDGTRVAQVQALDDGEKMTIIEPKPTRGARPVRHIIHGKPDARPAEGWGQVEHWGAEDRAKAEASSAQAVASVGPPVPRPGAPEPLLNPEKFTRAGATSAEPPLAGGLPAFATPMPPPGARLPGEEAPRPAFWARMTGAPAAPTPAPAKPAQPAPGGLWARLTWSSPSPAPRAEAPVGPRSPFGMASVSAAHQLQLEDLRRQSEAARKGKAPGAPENAFLRGGPVVSLPGGPTLTTGGVPEGMGNAFTQATTSRPIPADFGVGHMQGPGAFPPRPGGPRPPVPPKMPAGMPPEAQAMIAMHHQMMMAQFQMMMGPRQPMMNPAQAQTYQQQMYRQQMAPPATVLVQPESQTPRLLSALRESLMPSERQMAADQLRRVDWVGDPRVVPALVQAAEKDPAPMVRVSCLRALGQMKASTLPVVQALERLRDDTDIRVREEAHLTLAALKTGEPKKR